MTRAVKARGRRARWSGRRCRKALARAREVSVVVGCAALETVVLDGSEGEGGGQILRTALSLSLITGRPFVIEKIRANRKPTGLRPQHLACVRGAEAISDSESS